MLTHCQAKQRMHWAQVRASSFQFLFQQQHVVGARSFFFPLTMRWHLINTYQSYNFVNEEWGLHGINDINGPSASPCKRAVWVCAFEEVALFWMKCIHFRFFMASEGEWINPQSSRENETAFMQKHTCILW